MVLDMTFIIPYYTQDMVGEKPKLLPDVPHRICMQHGRLRAKRTDVAGTMHVIRFRHKRHILPSESDRARSRRRLVHTKTPWTFTALSLNVTLAR